MSKNKLIIEMTIFTALLFMGCSLVVINEKSKEFLVPKVDKKINEYIEKKYKNIKNDIILNKTKYNKVNSTFEMKVQNKNNKNLYFIVKYKNKKFTSTYQDDYIEGNTLISHLENKLTNDLKSKKYPNINVNLTRKLNKYNTLVREELIKEQDIQKLDIYNISINLESKTFTQKEITSVINKFYSYLTKNDYNPKFYNFTIINSSEITEEIKIKNLTKNLIMNDLNEIISGIIKNDQSINTKYNIDFKYSK